MLVDFRNLETTPGSQGPFAPPANFRGSAHHYAACLKLTIGQNRARYQQVAALIGAKNKGVPVKFVGPYAEAAEQVVEDITKLGLSETIDHARRTYLEAS